MGTYSRVVSVVKPINQIRTFIGGEAKDITSAWVFVNSVRKQVFPTTEEYTEVYSKTASGTYSTTLGFGKYKIVLSGAGGAGGAAAAKNIDNIEGELKTYGQNGFAGEKNETIIMIGENETKNINIVIGQGGGQAYVTATSDMSTMVATAGTGGTGYVSGTAGASTFGVTTGYTNASSSVAGGGGGGSSRVLVDGAQLLVSKGGNGGEAGAPSDKSGTVYTLRTATGGIGGSGGTTTGSGSSGGIGRKTVTVLTSATAYSNAGTDGYIHIYKSNIYPA